MTKVNTIKIIDLIKGLHEVLESEGNIPVVMSKDSEGNGFGTLSEDFVSDCVSIQNGLCVLYPWAERQELEDIKGAKQDEYEEDEADDEDDAMDADDPPYGCLFNDDE